MKHHKDKALEKACLCKECPNRFICFTQERVFSDPIYQGLFEALMAKGRTRDQALDEVTEEIKSRMPRSIDADEPYNPNIPYQPYTAPGTAQPGPWYWHTYTDGDGSSGGTVTYTKYDGEEISWNVNANGLYSAR